MVSKLAYLPRFKYTLGRSSCKCMRLSRAKADPFRKVCRAKPQDHQPISLGLGSANLPSSIRLAPLAPVAPVGLHLLQFVQLVLVQPAQLFLEHVPEHYCMSPRCPG